MINNITKTQINKYLWTPKKSINYILKLNEITENRLVNRSLASFISWQWCYKGNEVLIKTSAIILAKIINNNYIFHRCSKRCWFCELSGYIFIWKGKSERVWDLNTYLGLCCRFSSEFSIFKWNVEGVVVFCFTLCCVSATLWNKWKFYKKWIACGWKDYRW